MKDYWRCLLQSFLAMEHALIFCLSLTGAVPGVTGKPNARMTVPDAVWTSLLHLVDITNQNSLCCLSRMYIVGMSLHDRTLVLGALSFQEIFRICLGYTSCWASCPAYVEQVSLSYSSVLKTQALYTTILVYAVSLSFSQTCVAKYANTKALSIYLLISASKLRYNF